MNAEVEAMAVDALGEGRRPRHGPTRPAGSPCANCGVMLQGAWCHACGQLAEDFHRSIGRLCMEAVEGLTHADGRLWRTLPDLILHPARLTRAYIDGHRAIQIPPLRLFLVVLLLVFLAGSVGSTGGGVIRLQNPGESGKANIDARIDTAPILLDGRPLAKTNSWLKTRLRAALHDPERFSLILESQGERFAFMTLPIAAGLLCLLFAFQRQFFVFDHTIFALHSLSFLGLLISLMSLIDAVWDDGAPFVLLAAPVHLFFHMRGVYHRSIVGTFARMVVLGVLSGIGFLFLLLGLVLVGLNAMHA